MIKPLPLITKSVGDALVPGKGRNGERNWSPPKEFKRSAPQTSLNIAMTKQPTLVGRTVRLTDVKLIA